MGGKMAPYNDTLEGYIYRKKRTSKNQEKKKPLDQQKNINKKIILEKLKDGIVIAGFSFYSIEQVKQKIKNLKEQRKEVKNEAMNHADITRKCIELNKDYDEVIYLYQEKIDLINQKIYEIKQYFISLDLD